MEIETLIDPIILFTILSSKQYKWARKYLQRELLVARSFMSIDIPYSKYHVGIARKISKKLVKVNIKLKLSMYTFPEKNHFWVYLEE